ncbi:hypothetical protein G6L37_34645 [Agrobacterium rubi]|nr:hypothetical protein [Agrobacterium rubi]NTF23707.1 hypothetical protein [Agrobacterium rubi]
MTDTHAYMKAREYFLNLYRSHLESARAWRGQNRKQAAWSMELAGDCRAKLINGGRLRRAALTVLEGR